MISFSSPSSLSSSSCSAPTSDSQPPEANSNLDQEAEPEAAYKLIPVLQDDVALNCLARVPWCHHPTLSLVSKPIRSLVSSPFFFNTRSILHATQPILYLRLSRRFSDSHQWLALSLNPLPPSLPIRLPYPHRPFPSRTFYAAYAVLGSDFYVIGGRLDMVRSPQVWVYDCRLNCWQEGPAMRVPRHSATAAVLDGKIYVMGGQESGSSIWVEVLDPVVGSWEEVVSPFDGRTTRPPTCVAMGGKIYAMDNVGGFAYDPRSGVWEKLERELLSALTSKTCLVDEVLYCCDNNNRINGLEVREVRKGAGIWKWKEVKGLDRVLPMLGTTATLAGAGGKLFVVSYGDGLQKSEVWCSQVEVHKNNKDGELYATICWSHKILSSLEFLFDQCFVVEL